MMAMAMPWSCVAIACRWFIDEDDDDDDDDDDNDRRPMSFREI